MRRTAQWKIIKGKTSVLIVAAHAAPHLRRGKVLPADIGTAAFVSELCRRTQSWGIIALRSQPDPNWYCTSPFRKEVFRLIREQHLRVVIDVHGRRITWPRIIDAYPNSFFRKQFKRLMPANFSVQKFKKNAQITIVEDLARKGIPGIELEIRKDGRIGPKREQVFRTVLLFIRSIVNIL
ncbi:MAG: hypothetical protein Q7S16_02660 [bacterium]|nr:hypothetical protein [bacterium]